MIFVFRPNEDSSTPISHASYLFFMFTYSKKCYLQFGPILPLYEGIISRVLSVALIHGRLYFVWGSFLKLALNLTHI